MCLLYHSAGHDQESWNSGTLLPRPEQVLRCWELKHLSPGFQDIKARKLVSWYMFQRFLYPIFLVCGHGFLSCHTLSDFVVRLHLIDNIESLLLNSGNDKHFQIVNVVKAKELYTMLLNSSFSVVVVISRALVKEELNYLQGRYFARSFHFVKREDKVWYHSA